VLLIRQLGLNIHELEEATDSQSVGWETLFETIRRKVDPCAPPREQGRRAARLFREARGLRHGKSGIGEIMRGNLRSLGILIVETPLPESRVEGCTFSVGKIGSTRPCLFANLYGTTWFRRNEILMHELAHAIFDPNEGAYLDFADEVEESIPEHRADAFAQETLVPPEVLRHHHMRVIGHSSAISAEQLAELIAETHVEKRLLVHALLDADLLHEDAEPEVVGLDVSTTLRTFTDRALSAEEYISKHGRDRSDWLHKRETTIPSRTIRLPVAYVRAVVDTQHNGTITVGRAAELLMIQEGEYCERFGEPDESEEPE
jgi:Zn-dependent peptidase ImmA (M78 family)